MKKLFLMSTLFVAIAFLFGCGYNLEKAKETLEEEGYNVTLVTEENLAKYQDEDATITGVIIAEEKGLLDLDNVMIYTFKTAKDAKAYAEKAEEKNVLNYTIVVKGNAVILGTDEDVVKKLK